MSSITNLSPKKSLKPFPLVSTSTTTFLFQAPSSLAWTTSTVAQMISPYLFFVLYNVFSTEILADLFLIWPARPSRVHATSSLVRSTGLLKKLSFLTFKAIEHVILMLESSK